ncbi:hypothetical protein [Brochothrix campestris]|uniref:Lipoprotein n=1 Tax=Brochothrix campestris FSL F6-1037 TaxID=1265861 RepID=W7CJJ3_9LIST|nr:hypothetical protein [Brochothrix campestris]EUJ39549.1 hypothetical protein BCAMP_06990 [Brochothrix campestris FSL F6-1037]
MKKWLVLCMAIGGIATLSACQNETSKSATSVSSSSTDKATSSESSEVASSSEIITSDEQQASSEATVAVVSSTTDSVEADTNASVQTTGSKEVTESATSVSAPESSVDHKPVSSLDKDTKTILKTFLEYEATQADIAVDFTTLTMTRKGQDVPLTLVLGNNEGMIRESVVNNQEAHQSTIANYNIKGDTINITVTTSTGEETVYTKQIK